MKKIKLYIFFEETGKTMEHTMSISDSLYKFLSLPYGGWDSDLTDIVLGKNEENFYEHIFDIESIIMGGIMDKQFGISQMEWTFDDREVKGDTIFYHIYVEK